MGVVKLYSLQNKILIPNIKNRISTEYIHKNLQKLEISDLENLYAIAKYQSEKRKVENLKSDEEDIENKDWYKFNFLESWFDVNDDDINDEKDFEELNYILDQIIKFQSK